MKVKKKSWLGSYIDFFKNFSQTSNFKDLIHKINTEQNPESYLYRTVQPTGLMYGLPLGLSDHSFPDMKELDEHEKMKIILLDCFINCSLLLKNKGLSTDIDIEMLLNDITQNIAEFYSEVFPIATDKTEAETKEKEIELLLDKRVFTNKNWNQGFWTSYFQNSLLFLDIIYFSRWMQKEDKARLQKEKEDVYFLIIKIIASSANANSHIEKEERSLFENFLQSAKMKEDKVKMANDYFYKGIALDSIELSGINSWIIKKYLLEIAILTIWSDRVVDEYERVFLNDLNAKLGFSQQEFEESLIAIESFALSYWEHIPYISNKTNYNKVYESLVQRINLVISQNFKQIDKGLAKSDSVMRLLSKSLKEDLSPVEKEMLKSQFIGIVKEIPSLAIFLLPGGSILLPLLLEILPRHLERANGSKEDEQ